MCSHAWPTPCTACSPVVDAPPAPPLLASPLPAHRLAGSGATVLAAHLALTDDQPSALVYDLAWLAARAHELQRALPGFSHCLALKAAPYAALVQRYAAWGFGFEAASFTEGLVAHHAAPGATVLFDSPAKTRTDIARAEALGWVLSANSADELDRLHAPAVLRINTQVGAGRIAATSVADARSRFGEPLDALTPEALARLAADPRCAGWHAHVGSHGCSIELLVHSARRLADLALRHPGTRWLNLGGGLPLDASFTDYAQALRRAVPELFDGRWTVFTEMGRSLLAAGARAYSRIESSRRGVATIHLGADFLLRRAYRPEDWAYPLRALDARFAPRQPVPQRGEDAPEACQRHTIAGPLCFAGDVLGTVDAPPLREGDIIEIDHVGAYATSMWSRHCSRRMPPVYGLEADGRCTLLSAGESEADLLHLWRAPDAATG